ncbi:MAG: hypothetical protein ACYC6A_16335 [Armatimonadota bacterium]
MPAEKGPTFEAVLQGKRMLDFLETEGGPQDLLVGLAGEARDQAQGRAGGALAVAVRFQQELGLMAQMSEASMGWQRFCGDRNLLSSPSRDGGSCPPLAKSGGKKAIETGYGNEGDLRSSRKRGGALQHPCSHYSANPPAVKKAGKMP